MTGETCNEIAVVGHSEPLDRVAIDAERKAVGCISYVLLFLVQKVGQMAGKGIEGQAKHWMVGKNIGLPRQAFVCRNSFQWLERFVLCKLTFLF